MLKNKKEYPVQTRYNGIDISINPDQMLDVLDFNITADQIQNVERHIIKEYPGVFESIARPSAGLSTKESDKKIIDLQSQLEVSEKLNESSKKANEDLNKKVAELNTVISGLEGKIEGLKAQVGELKAKLKAKDYPDAKAK